MRIRFIWVGRTRDQRLREMEEDYLHRVEHYFPCELVVARPSTEGADARRIAREGLAIRERLKPGDVTIVLDPQGREMDSGRFSEFLTDFADRSTREITFVIGGHLGLDRDLTESATCRLALSRMTFPHELCRVLLLEQVYRACTLRCGTPYHK